MGSIPGRVKRFESAVGFCLLAVLLVIGASILVKQSLYDMSRFGINTGAELQVVEKEKTPLSLLIPDGFEALSEIETYTAENLYEKINGKAPLYTEAGFVKLFTRRLVNKDNEDLWMELFVYDMGAAKNAFSVYSLQQRPDAQIMGDMGFAYKSGNALYLAAGRYYVELVGSSESDELFKVMVTIAKDIKASFAVDDTPIAELTLLPQENLVPGSIKLFSAGVFGFEGLSGTFTAKYEINNETVTVFLSRRAGEQEAKEVADGYYKFLIDNGAEDKGQLAWGDGKIAQLFGYIEIVFSNEVYVGGVHEAESRNSAVKAAIMLNDKLSEAVQK